MSNIKLVLKRSETKVDEKSVKPLVASASYDIYCINKSDWSITHTKVNNGTKLPIIPKVDRTCLKNHTCQECFDDENYAPVLSVTRTDAPFDLSLVLEKGTQGAESEIIRIEPDPDFPGEVICFNVDHN